MLQVSITINFISFCFYLFTYFTALPHLLLTIQGKVYVPVICFYHICLRITRILTYNVPLLTRIFSSMYWNVFYFIHIEMYFISYTYWNVFYFIHLLKCILKWFCRGKWYRYNWTTAAVAVLLFIFCSWELSPYMKPHFWTWCVSAAAFVDIFLSWCGN